MDTKGDDLNAMTKNTDPMAELIAMRASGEITSAEFIRARDLLREKQKDDASKQIIFSKESFEHLDPANNAVGSKPHTSAVIEDSKRPNQKTTSDQIKVEEVRTNRLLRGLIVIAALATVIITVATYYQYTVAIEKGFSGIAEMQEAAGYDIADVGEWRLKGPDLKRKAEELSDAKEAAEQAAEVQRRREQAKVDALKAQEKAKIDAAKAQEQAKINEIKAQDQAKVDAAKALADAEKLRFRCLSAWDGNMREFADVIKETLRDPSSFEHVKSFASAINSDGSQYITIQFRARNGFGGLNVASAKAKIQNSTCDIINWSMIK